MGARTQTHTTFNTTHQKLQADRIMSKQPLMAEATNIAVKQVAEKIAEVIVVAGTPDDLESETCLIWEPTLCVRTPSQMAAAMVWRALTG